MAMMRTNAAAGKASAVPRASDLACRARVIVAVHERLQVLGLSRCEPEKCSTFLETLSKLKALLRKKAARSFDTLCDALGEICELFDPIQCRNCFKAAGYEAD